MNYFRMICLIVLIWGTDHFIIYSQPILVQKTTITPTAANFTYPQSVFVDSQNGNIWVTDFDNNRVLRFDVSELTTINENKNSSMPSEFALEQNYPNPFNSSTLIRFSTGFTGNVKLELYNILGKKIMTLYDDIATSNTVYVINFDAKLLSSGIYFYSLITERGNAVKRLCLLK